MKRVSHEVIRALKKAGYKFTPIQSSFFVDDTNAWYSEEDAELYSLPYAMEVWLWLWREKKIYINTGITNGYTFAVVSSSTSETGRIVKIDKDFYAQDPEDAIIAAIEFLVEHKLLK